MAIRRAVTASSINGTDVASLSGFRYQVESGRNFPFRQSAAFSATKLEMPSMVRVVRGLCTFASIFLIAAIPVRAQLATAELNGRVTDSSGAVLPGATVTVTQTATGLVRTAVTESNGTYLLSSLPTGPYRLE